MVAVREATAAERRDWDELVARFPNCRLVHKRPWIEWLEACGCGQPLYLVFELNGTIVAALPGLLVRLGLLRLYGSPLPGWQRLSVLEPRSPVRGPGDPRSGERDYQTDTPTGSVYQDLRRQLAHGSC